MKILTIYAMGTRWGNLKGKITCQSAYVKYWLTTFPHATNAFLVVYVHIKTNAALRILQMHICHWSFSSTFIVCYASRWHSKAMTIIIYTIPGWMQPQRIEIMNKNKRKYQPNLCRKEERLDLKNLPETSRYRVWKQRTLYINLQ